MGDRDDQQPDTPPASTAERDALVSAVELLDQLIERYQADTGAPPERPAQTAADPGIPILDDIAVPGGGAASDSTEQPAGKVAADYGETLARLEETLRGHMERMARETRLGVLAELREGLETLLQSHMAATAAAEDDGASAGGAPPRGPAGETGVEPAAAGTASGDAADAAPVEPAPDAAAPSPDAEPIEDTDELAPPGPPEQDDAELLRVPGAEAALRWESEAERTSVADLDAEIPGEAWLDDAPASEPPLDEHGDRPDIDTLELDDGRPAPAVEPVQEPLFDASPAPESDADAVSLSMSDSLGMDIDQFLAELETLKSETKGPEAAAPAAGTPAQDDGGPPAESDSPPAAEPAGAMDKAYDPAAIETHWYRHWETRGFFQPSGQGEPFCIMLPPPNVTGSLHMGHAFQDTIMDALIRYRRMRGDNTLWQGGMDHAGIATQMVVERQLASRDLDRKQLGRDAFEQEVWRWKRESGGTITRQLRRLGASLDWSRERFTLDAGLSGAVREVFVRLYEEGLIYRGQRLVNWDPVLHTAISDLEVVASEEDGRLWHMRYPLANGDGFVVVATTRPETMLGDTAVAVHPRDDRYRHLIDQHVKLPLTDREIPIVGDEYVDPEFGSGCVKITPGHDFNDYQIGLRHDLPLINIFTPDAALNENAPPAYQGLDRYAARERIVEDLDAQGLLENVEAHRLTIPRGDRTQAVCEPYLTDQWFVKIQPLAEPAIAAVRDGRIRFVPEGWDKTYFEWMGKIEDWCISRQLWWGHRIPAWYDADGEVYVGHSEDQIRVKHKLDGSVRLTQDEDVLDTWFSSALWPFSTLGWPAKTAEFKTFYPTSVLVTGFDIIFFWVARMIMMGLKFAGDVPFRTVYIHGLVRDAHGQKMSKSKGNILDPLDLVDGTDLDSLIAKRTSGLMRPEDADQIARATRDEFPDGIPPYGTDALRFTFASLATLGRNINFDTGRIAGHRNFCNKIWNAARFVLNITEDQDCGIAEGSRKRFGVAERWIVSKLLETEQAVREAMDSYRFDIAAQAVHAFIWDEYCDWYIEFSKVTLNNEKSESLKRGTRGILLSVLEAAMRLAHPLMPFITEEIWQRLARRLELDGDSIMLQSFPKPQPKMVDADAMREFEWLKLFILGVRRIRADNDIAPGKALPVLFKGGSADERRWLAQNLASVNAIARTESIRICEDRDPGPVATSLAGEMTLLVPLADLIDRDAERKRLRRELEKNTRALEQVRAKLANERFLERAPAEVIEKERAKLAELEGVSARLGEQLTRIDEMD